VVELKNGTDQPNHQEARPRRAVAMGRLTGPRKWLAPSLILSCREGLSGGFSKHANPSSAPVGTTQRKRRGIKGLGVELSSGQRHRTLYKSKTIHHTHVEIRNAES
jgi:hypothetical protein